MNKTNIIILIACVIFATWWFGNEPLYDYIQKDLKKENAELKTEIERINKLKQVEFETIRYIETKKKNKKDENINATNAVYSLNEREIDSAIRAYKHTNRK